MLHFHVEEMLDWGIPGQSFVPITEVIFGHVGSGCECVQREVLINVIQHERLQLLQSQTAMTAALMSAGFKRYLTQ